jgi:hypothetical protein
MSRNKRSRIGRFFRSPLPNAPYRSTISAPIGPQQHTRHEHYERVDKYASAVRCAQRMAALVSLRSQAVVPDARMPGIWFSIAEK